MVSLTFIGHASWLVEGDGWRVITDPIFSKRIAGIWPRLNPPALTPESIGPLDAVLISHPHLDHMDLPSLKLLKEKSGALMVPEGTGNLAERLNYSKTVATDIWERTEFSTGFSVTATPAVHLGIRGMGMGASARGAAGYVIESGDLRLYFAGDTAYGQIFTEIRERLRPHAALLPIGAYRPWFFMRHFHMSPALAVKAFIETGADWCVPYHYGSFVLSLEHPREPLRLFKKEAIRNDIMNKVVIVPRGGTAKLGGAYPPVTFTLHSE